MTTEKGQTTPDLSSTNLIELAEGLWRGETRELGFFSYIGLWTYYKLSTLVSIKVPLLQ
jgi:hypothetical protein